MMPEDPVRAWIRREWRGEPVAPDDALARGAGTAGNERLTGLTGLVLVLLLAAEGVTILFLGPLVLEHIFIGMLLIGPAALKLGSTGYRFARYYTRSPRYRRRGPPQPWLRALAPLVVLSTVAVFGTGVALVALGHRHGQLLAAHKASFVVFIVVTGVHVLAYAVRMVGVSLGELRPRRDARLRGRGARSALVLASLAAGLALALATLPMARSWTRGREDRERDREALALVRVLDGRAVGPAAAVTAPR
jgi:hypothetical protein